MTEAGETGIGALPLAALRHVDEVCSHFESAWTAGQRPRIEDYVSEAPPAERGLVLRELIALEVHYRRLGGEAPSTLEYQNRFPDVDETWLSQAVGGTPPGDAQGLSAVRSTGVGSRYRPLHLHAQGGLGEVWLARDEELGRAVALKRMQAPRAGDPEQQRRFLGEAEITGRLEHPSIVPVYGLVTGDDGGPCYAMRFIQGQTLQGSIEQFHAADQAGRDAGARRLALRQLLGRFVAVCNAIAYAHSQGVIHRDLKPANIMLGPYGETLVMDWGLAKVVGSGQWTVGSKEDGGEEIASMPSLPTVHCPLPTAEGQVIGTPAYMSPEQAAGRNHEIGPASDVYSLGATLYTLLTGQAPFAGTSAPAVLDQVQRGAWVPPRQRCKDVPRALEAVCMKALALQPGQRYESALALAADVEHWLADEPVAAHREPVLARGARWGRRHRGLIRAAIAVLLVAVLLLSGATVLLTRAYESERQAKSEAKQEQKRAESVTGYLVKAFRSPDPERDGRKITVAEMLKRADKEVDQEFADDPVTRGQLLEAVGMTYDGLGLPADAVAVHERALAIRREALEAEHPATVKATGYLAAAYLAAGRSAEAVPLFEWALPRLQARLGTDHADTISARANLGMAYQAVGRWADALPLLEEAQRLWLATLGPEHVDRLISLDNLGQAYQYMGRPAEAISLHEEALRLLRVKLGTDNLHVLGALNNLTMAYQSAGRLADALRSFEELVPLARAKLGPDHPNTLTALNNLAHARYVAGRTVEAVPLWEEALGLQRVKLGGDHPDTIISTGNLAVAYVALGRAVEAVELFEELLALARAKLGADHPYTLSIMNNLGMAYRGLGRPADALRLVQGALPQLRARQGADHPQTVGSLSNLAFVYGDLGRPADALALFDEVLRLRRAKQGAEHPETLTSMNHLALAYQEVHRLAEAEDLLTEAVSLHRRGSSAEGPALASSLALLGECRLRQDKFIEAETVLRQGLAIRAKKQADHWSYYHTQTLLGSALVGQQRFPEAEPLLLAGHEGLTTREKTLLAYEKRAVDHALDRLVRLYEARGQSEKAAQWRARQARKL